MAQRALDAAGRGAAGRWVRSSRARNNPALHPRGRAVPAAHARLERPRGKGPSPAQPRERPGPGEARGPASRKPSQLRPRAGGAEKAKAKVGSRSGGLAQAPGEAAGRPCSPKGSPRGKGAAAELSPKGRPCSGGPAFLEARCARLFSAFLWPWDCFLSPPWCAEPAPRGRLVGWEIRQGGSKPEARETVVFRGQGLGLSSTGWSPAGRDPAQGLGPGAVRAPPSLWE